MEEPNILDHLPLSESTFLILLCLASGPRHGYAILKDVQGLSQGRVVLSTGTLYGAIRRLLDAGWIVRLEESKNTENGHERKEYELTRLGRQALHAEIERMDRLVRTARPLTAAKDP
jgi:DNA-binding PadR family transcriptional regulator